MAATAGVVGSAGSGRLALAHSARTLPGVSCPSRVVRSIIEMAVSRPHCLAVVLMDRLASMAARASAPTRSTPGSPCRNPRSEAWDQVTLCVSAGALIAAPSFNDILTRRNVSTGNHTGLMDLNGMIALVTGAADGIGAGIAERLAAEGMHVVVADPDETTGRESAGRIGGRFVA